MRFSWHGITIEQLYKQLGEFVARGDGRKRVCIAKETFTHNLESDGCTILYVHDCRMKTINLVDGDGGTKVNSKGQECYTTVAILFGIDDNERNEDG